MKGLYSGCGGDGICGWSDSPRACIGTGTDTTPGNVVSNYEYNAGRKNPGVVGNWDYGDGNGLEKITCKPRSSDGHVPCYCKKSGANMQTTQYTVIPNECTAVNRYLFHNRGTNAGENTKACGNPNTDGAGRYPCFCKRGYCKDEHSCMALQIGTSKCGCLSCYPGYFFDPAYIDEASNGCVKCAKSKYRSADDNVTNTCLEDCPAGKYTATPGAAHITACRFPPLLFSLSPNSSFIAGNEKIVLHGARFGNDSKR